MMKRVVSKSLLMLVIALEHKRPAAGNLKIALKIGYSQVKILNFSLRPLEDAILHDFPFVAWYKGWLVFL